MIFVEIIFLFKRSLKYNLTWLIVVFFWSHSNGIQFSKYFLILNAIHLKFNLDCFCQWHIGTPTNKWTICRQLVFICSRIELRTLMYTRHAMHDLSSRLWLPQQRTLWTKSSFNACVSVVISIGIENHILSSRLVMQCNRLIRWVT